MELLRAGPGRHGDVSPAIMPARTSPAGHPSRPDDHHPGGARLSRIDHQHRLHRTSAGSPHTPADNSTTGNCQNATVTGTNRNVDLSIAKTASIASPTHILTTDSTFTYTLTVSNAGPDAAPTVTVSDPLAVWYSGDAGTTGGSAVITGTGAGESCSFGSTVTCTLKDITSGAPRTITITLNRPFRDGAIANTATVSTPDAIDTDGTNNSATANIIVDPLADVAVTVHRRLARPGEGRSGADLYHLHQEQRPQHGPGGGVAAGD